MIIAVNFPIQAIGKEKPEKIRALTGFEPVTSANTGAILWLHSSAGRASIAPVFAKVTPGLEYC